MLLQFRVRNYRSFAEEQVFSMVPSKGASHVHDTGSKFHPEALKVAAVYGPNGSGKSNLVRALTYLQHLVRDSGEFNSDDEMGADPHKLDDSFADAPSLFEITFAAASNVWRYGVEISNTAVIQEWLFARQFETSRERRLFERYGTQKGLAAEFHVSRELAGYRPILESKTNVNQLFISKLDQFAADETRAAYTWIVNILRPVHSVSDFPKAVTAHWCGNEDQKRLVTEFLKAADVQIDDVVVERSRQSAKNAGAGLLPLSLAASNSEPILSVEKDYVTLYTVAFQRRTRAQQTTTIPFEDESLGTRNLFSLAGPLMQSLEFGYCVVIDEMNQSFHPDLLRYLVELFYSTEVNSHGAQLIMTSHDVSIMDVLERDQIWLCEKDEGGATNLFALSDFGSVKDGGTRRRAAFGKQYLENRFGGLPNVNKLSLMAAFRTYRRQRDDSDKTPSS